MKNFWQSYPASLEVREASGPNAKLIAWLWSPDAPEMDMRFYDTHGHGLDAAYEDAQPGLSTAHGVSRTSELTLCPLTAWPSHPETVSMAEEGSRLPLLACSPEYLHSTGVFGTWSLSDRSTAFRKSIEDGLDSVLAYYQKQSGTAPGTASGSTGISSTPTPRHATRGTTTGADTPGITPS